METLAKDILTTILAGGPQAIIAILLAGMAMLALEVRRLRAELQKKDERIDKIVDDYYRGNMTLSEALNSLKLVLFEVKSKL